MSVTQSIFPLWPPEKKKRNRTKHGRGYRQPMRYAIPERVLARVWDRIDIRTAEECWPWLGSIGSHGYGYLGWYPGDPNGPTGVKTTAHRAAYTSRFGPIPEGMTVDHLCRNRPCCNPSHLRLLTNIENARGNQNAIKTHCKNGHEFTPENTYVYAVNGSRNCRACLREKDRARYRARCGQ